MRGAGPAAPAREPDVRSWPLACGSLDHARVHLTARELPPLGSYARWIFTAGQQSPPRAGNPQDRARFAAGAILFGGIIIGRASQY